MHVGHPLTYPALLIKSTHFTTIMTTYSQHPQTAIHNSTYETAHCCSTEEWDRIATACSEHQNNVCAPTLLMIQEEHLVANCTLNAVSTQYSRNNCVRMLAASKQWMYSHPAHDTRRTLGCQLHLVLIQHQQWHPQNMGLERRDVGGED
eukprot:c16444_g2_i1 orf=2-445(-)